MADPWGLIQNSEKGAQLCMYNIVNMVIVCDL